MNTSNPKVAMEHGEKVFSRCALTLALGGLLAVSAHAQSAPPQTGGYQPPPPGFTNLPAAVPMQEPPPVIPLKPGQGAANDLVGKAFNAEYPMSVQQIEAYQRLLEEMKRVSAAKSKPRAVPESSRVPISLTPGRAPHVLRLSADMVSTVIFTDSTGAPWPIVAVIAGAKDKLDIKRDDKRAPHIFTVAPLESYVTTNLSVWLENSTVPIVMSVVGQQRLVDFMLEMAVQARGPNAKAPTVDYALSNELISADQNEILNGLTPQGAIELKVTGGDARAWVIGNKMMLRTSMLLRAPTARRVFSGADGSKVYELPHTPVVNMVSEGRTITLSVSGFPAPYISPASVATTR